MRFKTDGSDPVYLPRSSNRPVAVASAADFPDSTVTVRPDELLNHRSMLALQRRAGNSAVIKLLEKTKPRVRSSPLNSVQRCPGGCAPGTCEGHEPQQEPLAPVVMRVPPRPMPLPPSVPAAGATDFQINRVGKSTQQRIFFAKGSFTLDGPATVEVDTIRATNAATPLTNVRLMGYASADETATVGQKRADAVKAALERKPDPVLVASSKSATAPQDTADFTESRSVEIVVGSAPATKLDCKAKDHNGVLVNPPTQDCIVMDPETWVAFHQAWPIAKEAMEKAVAAVTGTPTAGDAAVVDQFFGNHSAATLTELRTNLGNLHAHVFNLNHTFRCGGQCDTEACDRGSTIAYNKNYDAASKMTLCVPTFKSISVNDAARNLIHESAHGTTPLGGPANPTEGTKDVAYRHERMLFHLTTAERLRNSDSYALFCLFLREIQTTHNPAAVPPGIATPEHDTTPGVSATNKPALDLALARLEKRLTWCEQNTDGLYGQAVKVRQKKKAWNATWAKEYMKKAAARFPLTKPPARPKLTDLARLAAIADRYSRMLEAVKTDLTVTQVSVGVATWDSPGADWTAPDKLTVGPRFFDATPDDQVSLLLEQLAKSTRDVEPAFIPAYVDFAAWIHSKHP